MGKRNREESKAEKKERKRRKKGRKKLHRSGENDQTEAVVRLVKGSEDTPVVKGKPNLWRKRLRFVVSLLPSTLGKTQKCIEDSIRLLLLKYSETLDGILLAFDDVRVEQERHGTGRGWILDELPYIHYNVSCEGLVFTPNVGTRLLGIVNECFPSHVGILIHNYFNGMISSNHLRARGFAFDPNHRYWKASQNDSNSIRNGDTIYFDVEIVHECEGALSLEVVNPSNSP